MRWYQVEGMEWLRVMNSQFSYKISVHFYLITYYGVTQLELFLPYFTIICKTFVCEYFLIYLPRVNFFKVKIILFKATNTFMALITSFPQVLL